jgi:hypothetical protein
MSTPFTYLAAAVGMAIAVPFSAPFVMGAPSAHADTGINNYVRCIQRDPEMPPKERAEDWLPTVAIIKTKLNSAFSPAEVVQRLVAAGVKPNHAVVEVQCVLATAA